MIPDTKVLIADVGEDVLVSGLNVADMDSGPVLFDGDTHAEAQYARMLNALILEAR